jgi:hypothetical protein
MVFLKMVQTAKGATDEQRVAAYFSSLKWTPWVKVVEAINVPKTKIAGGMSPREGALMERWASVSEMPEAGADGDAARRCPRRSCLCAVVASRRDKPQTNGGGKRRRAPSAMART